MSGFVRAERDRFGHALFRNERFCRGYAWDWLVAQASYQDRTIDVAGKTVKLRRGQLCHSIRYMAEAWNWDKAAVTRYLTRLKTETMIETGTETGQTIITICNYRKYQTRNEKTETPNDTQPETAARQQRDSSETKKKEGKRNKRKIDISPGGDIGAAFDVWNEFAHRGCWPEVRARGQDRAKKLALRLSEIGGLDGWREMITRASNSDFIRSNGFFTFDWVMSPINLRKVMEGNYDNRNRPSASDYAGRPDPRGGFTEGFMSVARADRGPGPRPDENMRDVTPTGGAGMADGPDHDPSQSFLRIAYDAG